MTFKLAHEGGVGSVQSRAFGGGSLRWRITNILWFPVATQLSNQEKWFLPLLNDVVVKEWVINHNGDECATCCPLDPDLAPAAAYKNGASGPNSPQWSHDSVLPLAKGNRKACVWHFSFYSGRLTLLSNTQKMGNSLSRSREIKRIINPTEEMFQFMPLYYGLWTLHRWSQKALFTTYQNISKSQDSRPFYGKYKLLLKPILPLRLSMLDLMKSQIPRPTTFFPRVVGNVSNHRVVLEWNIPKEIAELNISQGHVTIQNCAPKRSHGAMLLQWIPHHGHLAL